MTAPRTDDRSPPKSAAAPAAAPATGVRALVVTALAYGLLGAAALALAIPPGYASPLYPAAGVGLAAVLAGGPWHAAAVFVASAALNWVLNGSLALSPSGMLVPLGVGAGAALQALIGATLVRRMVRWPLTLSEPRDIARFFLFGAPVACIVSATWCCTVLVLAGTIPLERLPFSWLTWWIGDSLGTLIGAPVALTLIGRPRDDWRPRRLTVGLPLSVVTVLLGVLIMLVVRWDRQRVEAAFERDAASASAAVAFQMLQPLHALESLRGVFIASEDVSTNEMRLATRAWLQNAPSLQALGYAERVPRDQILDYQSRVRLRGHPLFTVFDRADGDRRLLATDADAWIIRDLEPLQRNGGALGVNILSVPAAREALLGAVRTDAPSATPTFTLTQSTRGELGVVVYRALYRGEPSTAADRLVQAQGVVFATLRIEDTLRDVLAQVPKYLEVCLIDTDPGASRRRLYGKPGCESTPAELQHVRPLPFAGRQWDVRVTGRLEALPGHGIPDAWLFSVVGLLAAAALGALLLTVTGRTRRIEVAVRERTAALEQQVREREQAQQALRGSEKRFRTIYNHVRIGLLYTNLRGVVKDCNPYFCELLGYRYDELIGMSIEDLTAAEDYPPTLLLSAQLARGEIQDYRIQKRYIAKDGRIIWAQASISLLPSDPGEPKRILAVIEDITEHLRLAEAERAREAAEAANRAKSDFLSRMSHELRTPLNAMLGFAQLLELDQRHPLHEAQRPWVGQIQQAGWHLLEMINDVLDLSRIESGNLKLTVQPLDLTQLLPACIALVERDAARRGIVIEQRLDPAALRLHGDETRVKQILTNLLSNAIKYNRDGGRVRVSSRRLDHVVEIVVSDSGLGMSPSQLAELFQPFNRLGRERSAIEGTGIGLVISRRLAELMSGTLRASSSEDAGSSFTLTLPAVDVEEAGPADALGVREPAPAYHRRRVLYIEDNETNIELMRGMLAQRPQVALEVAVDGAQGMAAARKLRPDLVLLDMHLPDVEGMALLHRLKADPSTRRIPIVVVSADALQPQIDAALDAGAERYLTKPVNLGELLAVIDDLLQAVDTRYD